MRRPLGALPARVLQACALLLLLLLAVYCARVAALAPERRFREAAAAAAQSASPAAVAAEVRLRLGVGLQAADVAVWQRLVAQGMDPARALQIVVAYRRAAGV